MIILFDIVFQSGDFHNQPDGFWSQFIINVLGALIGTLTALVIFTMQVRHERKKEKTKEDKLIKQRLNYFSSMINSIYDTVKRQRNFIKSFYETQRTDLLNIPQLKYLPFNDLDRFSKIQNHEDYYHAYLTYFGYTSSIVTEYREFYSIIDYLNIQTNDLQGILEKAMKSDYDTKMQYKIIVEKALDEAAIMFNKAKQDNKIDAFANFLNTSLVTFYTQINSPSDLNEIQTKFVDPVKTEIVKNYRANDFAIHLASELKKATVILAEIRLNNNDLANKFEAIYHAYKEAADKLETPSVKLNNLFSK